MRVLVHLLDAQVGGGQRVARYVAEGLVVRGHRVGLMVDAPGPAVSWFTELGAETTFVGLKTLRHPAGIRRAAAVMRSYDLVYSHTAVPSQILAETAARRARRPHVIHQHNVPHFSPQPTVGAAQRLLFRRLLHRSRFIAVAPHVCEALMAVGVPSEHVAVVPNGIPIPNLACPSARMDRRLRIGVLGRFDPQKGMDVFLEAVRRIGDGDAAFVIGGSGGLCADDDQRVRIEANQLGVSIVDPGEDGLGFLQGLDVVVMPSRHEGSPLVLLEAMALGKAVVATDVPGIRGIVGESSAAVLIPPDDPVALAAAIERMAGDPALRSSLGARARQLVSERYRAEDAVAAIIGILERAVGVT